MPADAPLATDPRFCRGCYYEVSGLGESAAPCPECGREFDLADPRTTADRVPSRIDRLLNRSATIPTAILIVLGIALWQTWLPRPLSFDEWRVWLWLNEAYGVEHTWLNAEPIRITWVGDRVKSVAGYDNAGKARWRVTRRGADRFDLQVFTGGVPHQSLLRAFNAVKVDLVGLRFVSEQYWESTGPFEAAGSRIEVLNELIRHYGIVTRPFLVQEDQQRVWYFDDQAAELVAIPIEEAEERIREELGEVEQDIGLEVPTYPSGWFTPPR